MILAIDLGTTNSVGAIWENGQARLLKSRHGSVLVPSVVSMDNKAILVGDPAKEKLRRDQMHTFALFKRSMGTKKSFGRQGHDAVTLSSFILKAIKEDAEAELGQTLTRAIITVPAYFNERQRQDTKLAAKLAGLEVVRLLNEPTAAALAYSINDKAEESKIIVLDLGGGTFDISIIEKFNDVLDIHASGGDCFLGGEDFTLMLQAMLAKQLPTALQTDHRLYALAELCKRRLSSDEQWKHTAQWDGQSLNFSIDRTAFETACEPLLDRMKKPIERALRDAKMQVSDFDHVVLAGGATRMPLIRKMVTQYFRTFPLMTLDPDTVVAQGAAVAAGMEEAEGSLKDRVLTDICPFTLGVEVVHQGETGVFSPIIERNQKVPISREQVYVPLHPDQKKLHITIYQGESRYVRDNVQLGDVVLPIVMKDAREENFFVRFTYDISGLLEVHIRTESTGKINTLLIQREQVMTEEQAKNLMETLQEFKIHPREAAENQWLMARANRLFEETLGDERQHIANLLGEFHRVLESQDDETIEKFSGQLKQVLDQLEGGFHL